VIFKLPGGLDASYLKGIEVKLNLEEAAKGYAMFKHRDDGCIKVVLKP
jgi:threonine dehydrogenase-like Zn-dependent dehydrogenase